MSSFGKVNFGANTGLKNDQVDEEKPMKYYTSNWYNSPSPENGVNFTQGFGISQQFIDTETKISRSSITNPRVRQDLGGFPVITGGLHTAGPIISEQISRVYKSCQDFNDGKWYERVFYDLKENPNHVQRNPSGTDTRMDTKELYQKK